MKRFFLRWLTVCAVAGLSLFSPAFAQQKEGDPLIVPGGSVGEVKLGTEMSEVEKKLGEANVGEGAAGRGWSGWFAPKEGGGRGYELDIYSHGTATSHGQVAVAIRVESPFFHTKEGISTKSSLAEFWKTFPDMHYVENAQSDDKAVEVYADGPRGIAVEVRRTAVSPEGTTPPAGSWGVCQAIIVFQPTADGGVPLLRSMRDMPSEM